MQEIKDVLLLAHVPLFIFNDCNYITNRTEQYEEAFSIYETRGVAHSGNIA